MTVIPACGILKLLSAACPCFAASHHAHLSGEQAEGSGELPEARLKQEQGPTRHNFLHLNVLFVEN